LKLGGMGVRKGVLEECARNGGEVGVTIGGHDFSRPG